MTTGSPRVLVADDDATVRLLMHAEVVKAGFQVCLAADGEEALHVFGEQSPDMVLLDVAMPGRNGFDVCAQLRRDVGDEFPIVMVTGMDDVESIQRAFDVGATDFLAKPLNWNLVGHRVLYLWRAYQTRIELCRANQRNTAVLSAIPDLMFRVREDGRLLEVHGGKSAALPHPGAELERSFSPEVTAAYRAAMDKSRAQGSVEQIEYVVGTDGHGTRHCETRIVALEKGEALCLVRDITERKEAEETIFRLAYFDTLTGLANRQAFMERLVREIKRASLDGGKLALLLVDLDGLKSINDTAGHGAGDQVLQETADRLRKAVRPADMVSRQAPEPADHPEIELARCRGDEFIILIRGMRHVEDVVVVADRIRELVRQPFRLAQHQVVLTACIGVAVYPGDGKDAETLVKHADTAMHHAKNKGRDHCEFYSISLTRKAKRRLNLVSNLHRALERDEFSLVYQPQLDVRTGQVLSLEALLRWHHPEQGLISPMDFIPLAEETGLILPIGEWVLRTACMQGAQWRAQGHSLRIAVNLSPVQLRDPRLADRVTRILSETLFAPEHLELEVTEGALMDENPAIETTLRALRETGLQFALDDFGTGYSSMSYLKRLPLSNIKVDQAFVRGLPGDSENHAIVGAILSLAKHLGFSTTAEGIETLEQAALLKQMDCDVLQGFYIAKPQPAADIDAVLSQHWDLEMPAGRSQGGPKQTS